MTQANRKFKEQNTELRAQNEQLRKELAKKQQENEKLQCEATKKSEDSELKARYEGEIRDLKKANDQFFEWVEKSRERFRVRAF